jgi:hypothetical protein
MDADWPPDLFLKKALLWQKSAQFDCGKKNQTLELQIERRLN